MLEANNVVKTFDGFRALDGANMTVPRGAVYGLVGPNGAGKSTIIRHFTGVYRPDSGQVTLDGQPVYENPAAKSRMAVIPDDWYYFPQASIRDMARLYAGTHPFFSWDRYHKLREAFPLPEKQLLRRMSKGMQKQAAFWLVMSCMPEVLVLDEPRRGKEFFRTFDLPAYLRKHFNMFGGTEYRVTLRCTADLEPVMRERFGREPVFCPEEDGYFHFDVPICVSQQFFGWVCGFGGKVEVTAPAAVRAQLHEMVQGLAEQHE